MYKYNQKVRAKSRVTRLVNALKSRTQLVVTVALGLVFCITPIATLAKGGLPTSPSPVVTPELQQVSGPPSYMAVFNTVSYSESNVLSATGYININNFVDREDGQYVSYNWGDGQTDTVQIMTLPGYLKSSAKLTVSGLTITHTYASEGPWKVVVTPFANDKKGKLLYMPATGYSFITENTLASCSGGIDEDRDGKIDLYDTDCAKFKQAETILALCSDGLDNDVSGKIDLYDPNCAQFKIPETTLLLCSDGIDNDVSGKIDLDDPNCVPFLPKEDTSEACSDGIDNDRDGRKDLFDADCTQFAPPENTPELCTDGIDNDYDGLSDGRDIDCAGQTPAENAADVCLDGIDNDFDGRFDWEDSDCADFVVPMNCPVGFIKFFFPGFGFICAASAGY